MVGRLKELIRYPEPVRSLVIWGLKVRYEDSVLGFLWSFLNPLGMMVIFAIVFTIMLPNNTIECFPIFILCALRSLFSFSLDTQQLAQILNAVGSLIAFYRVILYHGAPPAWDFLLRTLVTALGFLGLGYFIFNRYAPTFAEEV